MNKSKRIIVKGNQIGIVLHTGHDDFIFLTDMAKYKTYDSGLLFQIG